MDKHNTRAHAILSSSGAERWMNCPPSARLEEAQGTSSTSVYAEEGTTAHELAELMLKLEVLQSISDEVYAEKLADIMALPTYNDEMLIEVPKYVDYCFEQFEDAKQQAPGAIILIEQKIDLTAYIPDGFGSCDAIIIADGVMEVIDLKYGKGVAVSAVANKQLMTYGLGALHKYSMSYDIREILLTVAQPRLDSISSWRISADKLEEWGETELKPKAQIAFAGGGIQKAGSWCKFCKVKHRCKVLADDNLAIAKFEMSQPSLLTDDDIAHILSKANAFSDWLSSITAYALTEACTNNKIWPGYKLVEGVSRRKWLDEASATKAIRKNFPNLDDEDIFKTSLRSITDIERVVTKKKFTELLSDVVIKPQGSPSLVPISDKRPALGIEQAKADFS